MLDDSYAAAGVDRIDSVEFAADWLASVLVVAECWRNWQGYRAARN